MKLTFSYNRNFPNSATLFPNTLSLRAKSHLRYPFHTPKIILQKRCITDYHSQQSAIHHSQTAASLSKRLIKMINPATIAVTLSVLCALPSMASIAMIAETQHSDGDYAAGMIFITTLFSIITLPLVCLSL